MLGKLLIAVAAALAMAPSAQAARVGVADRALSAYSAHAVWSSIVFDSAGGERNVVDARMTAVTGNGRVRDHSATLMPALLKYRGGVCAIGPLGHEATCTGVCVSDVETGMTTCGKPLLAGFSADLGAGDDQVTVNGFAATFLYGGAGRDYLGGGDSNDVISAVDDEADRIRCGGGHDYVTRDAADVLVDPAACEDGYTV